MIIALYWGERKANLNDCVNHVVRTFERIGTHSPYLNRWYEKGRSFKYSPKAVDVNSPHQIRTLLLKGINRNDLDDSAIEDLGFRIALWNGEVDQFRITISIQCGVFCKIDGITNSVILNIDDRFSQTINGRIPDIFADLIEIWKPQWGKVFSFAPNEYFDDLNEIVYLNYP